MQSNVNQYMGSVHNLCFFPLLTLKQLQKVHVSAYKIRQIKHASCFIQDVCQYIFARAWTRSTSVNHILARMLQKKKEKKKRQTQSVRDTSTSLEIKSIIPDIGWRGSRENFIKEEAALLVNWQTLMKFARSRIFKLLLIFAASHMLITQTHTFLLTKGHLRHYSSACNPSSNHDKYMTNPTPSP